MGLDATTPLMLLQVLPFGTIALMPVCVCRGLFADELRSVRF